MIGFPARERLSFDDFLVFAHRSANYFHFFDSSIYFIKESFHSFRSFSSELLHEYMLKLKVEIVNLHNNYLLERQKLIGKNFRVVPFLFDEESLSPSDPNITIKGIFY